MEVFCHAGKSTVGNCVLIVDRVQKGVVHHLYCVDYAHAYYRRSADHARTFSPPVEIKKPFDQFASDYKFILRAIGPGNGTVHCMYERGAMTSYYDPAAVTLATFKLRELRAGLVGTGSPPTAPRASR
jgi:hypothetical protein